MKRRVEQLFEWILEILFPRKKTLIALENLVKNNQLRSLSKERDPGDPHFSLFSYQNPLVKELIWQIKYHKHPLLTKETGALLYEEILDTLSEETLFGHYPKTLLVPVPMSVKRRRDRGWNQTEEIAKAILVNDTKNIFSYSDTLLEKREGIIPQTETSSRTARLTNIIGAYVVKNPSLIQGNRIIVIDDVKTTGATFQEIESTFKKAGAACVLCFAIAH